MSWNDALVQYATKQDPLKDIPEDVYLTHNDHFTVIADAYPKSSYHFLVLPRAPFPLPESISPTSLSVSDLTSLKQFLTLPKETVLHVIGLMELMLEEVSERVEEKMRKDKGWADGVVELQWGFHAVPSMKHLHLHVMTTDLCSPSLKNKKHYNSFSPALGFWLPLEKVKGWVEDDNSNALRLPSTQYEPILKQGLLSHLTGESFATIPKLKAHLEGELRKAERKAERKAKGGKGS